MLTGLSIRDFVLIERLDVSPEPGLTVLTGETGAGKSILLDALGAACGGRSEAGLVRTGAEKASVTASFSLPPTHRVLSVLKEQDIQAEGEDSPVVILRRVIGADGRSKAFLNDQPVSVGLLREVGALLVEVHGQFDTHGLLDPATHRLTLDRFGALDLSPLRTAWTTWQDARKAEETARAAFLAGQQEEQALRDAEEDLARLKARVGEEAHCLERRQLLQGREKLASALTGAVEALGGETGAEAALITASRALGRIAPLGGMERLAQALLQIDAARDAVAEAQSALENLTDEMASEGSTLEEVEDRLYALRAAARRHGVAPDDLPGLTEELSRRLTRLDVGEDGLRALAQTTLNAQAAYAREAADLSARRRTVARKLEKTLQAELGPLKMERARFSVVLSEAPPGPWGTDTIQFQAVTNPGTPPGPLNRIASGGELARFMLALKVALAGVGEAITLVFDEVDQGVGGAVAAAVGDRLALLAQDVQVLVVTHAPQVAAKARHHWTVTKATTGKATRTAVNVLDEGARQEEVARMLAGDKVTEAARTAAKDLLNQGA